MPASPTAPPIWLTEWMQAHKIALWGAADLREFLTPPDETGKRFPIALSWAIPMNPKIMASIQNGPNQAYANEYAKVNSHINELSVALAIEIKAKGFRSQPLAASDRTDTVNIKGDFPHKTAATRAGLGWVGRHCQLITRSFGSWIRLGTVFTDIEISCGPPKERNFCGHCRRCVEACPAKALKGNAWYPGIPREELLDVRVCDQWKKEHYFHFHKGHNCGICSAVCPYGLKVLKKKSDIGVVEHSIFSWMKKNVGKKFKSLKPRAKDIQILAVDDESRRVRLQFVGGVAALPLYFWMFDRTINYLASKKNCAVRVGAKVAPPFDNDTIEGQIWLEPHPEPPRTPFKAAPHVCDLLVHAGIAKYENLINPLTDREVQGIRYELSNPETQHIIIKNTLPTPESDKEIFAERYRNVILQWTEGNKDRIIDSRRSYRWKNKTTRECVKERNEISKQIILSRIKNQGSIDLKTLDKITQWGFNSEFPCRETEKVLDATRNAFTFLDSENLIDATKTLLHLPGVGISRASKILGLFDQDNLCIYDSRVGQALRGLTREGVKAVLCPPGRNRPGDSVSNSEVWAEQYQRLIWTLEIVRDYLNDLGHTFRLADVEMALFIMGKEKIEDDQ